MIRAVESTPPDPGSASERDSQADGHADDNVTHGFRGRKVLLDVGVCDIRNHRYQGSLPASEGDVSVAVHQGLGPVRPGFAGTRGGGTGPVSCLSGSAGWATAPARRGACVAQLATSRQDQRDEGGMVADNAGGEVAGVPAKTGSARSRLGPLPGSGLPPPTGSTGSQGLSAAQRPKIPAIFS